MSIRFSAHVPTRIVFGRGTVTGLGAEVGQWGRRALVVCGRSAMRSTGILDQVLAGLSASGVKADVFAGVSANPRSDEIDAAIRLARTSGTDVVVGLGGGSAIDAAKALAVGMGHDSVGSLVGRTLDPSADALPVVAVPTTAGSGAEVTKGATITDVARGFRSGIRGDDLFPKVAVVDPALTGTLPLAVAVESGFDALAHAVEGCLARRAAPYNKAFAEQAIQLISGNLRRVAAGDRHPDVIEAMSLAALLGGLNVATASTCLPHRMQQAMGSAENTGPSHGSGLAILYPAWLDVIADVAADDLALVAAALGGTDARIEISRLRADIGLSGGLRAYGYGPDDIPSFVARVSGILDNDPYPDPTPELITSIYQGSLG